MSCPGELRTESRRGSCACAPVCSVRLPQPPPHGTTADRGCECGPGTVSWLPPPAGRTKPESTIVEPGISAGRWQPTDITAISLNHHQKGKCTCVLETLLAESFLIASCSSAAAAASSLSFAFRLLDSSCWRFMFSWEGQYSCGLQHVLSSTN